MNWLESHSFWTPYRPQLRLIAWLITGIRCFKATIRWHLQLPIRELTQQSITYLNCLLLLQFNLISRPDLLFVILHDAQQKHHIISHIFKVLIEIQNIFLYKPINLSPSVVIISFLVIYDTQYLIFSVPYFVLVVFSGDIFSLIPQIIYLFLNHHVLAYLHVDAKLLSLCQLIVVLLF